MPRAVPLRRCTDCGTTDDSRLMHSRRTGRALNLCKECKSKRTKVWRSQPASRKRQVAIRRRSLLAAFGITLEQYDEMLAAQGGGCAICGRACLTGRALAVDHDHETGVVRALLCVICNRYLGVVENFGTQAGAYLQRYGTGNPVVAAVVGQAPPKRPALVGSDRANAKLTEAQVAEMRARYAGGNVSQRKLAKEYGMGQNSIGRILRREVWQHVA
jgi:hypothetical protein